MYKMCTWHVVSMCVAWSAYITQNTTNLLCVLYILDMFLFIYEQRILIGYCLFTSHSPDHYHIALFGTCIIVSLQ